MDESEWIICLICRNKTRVKIRDDIHIDFNIDLRNFAIEDSFSHIQHTA